MLGHPLAGSGPRGKRVAPPIAQARDCAPRTCLNRLDAPALQGPHPALTGSPVDPGPVKQCPARGRLSYTTTQGKQRLGWQFAAAIASGDTRRKAAPFRVGPYPPIGPMRGPPSLPPASLTGSAVSRACAWATPGADAWHGPGERVRLTTCRQLPRRGEGASVHRGRPRGRRSAVQTPRACSPSRFGSGADWPLSLRAHHDASPRGVTLVTHPRHCPRPIPPAARLFGVDGVLETPPLPVPPPPCGNRWPDMLAGAYPLFLSSSAPCDLVSQERSRSAAGAAPPPTPDGATAPQGAAVPPTVAVGGAARTRQPRFGGGEHACLLPRSLGPKRA